MARRAAKRDSNETVIIEGLRECGCFVIQETNIDLYVYNPRTDTWTPIEVKTRNGKRTTYQEKLHASLIENFNYEVHIARSLDDALKIVGIIPED